MNPSDSDPFQSPPPRLPSPPQESALPTVPITVIRQESNTWRWPEQVDQVDQGDEEMEDHDDETVEAGIEDDDESDRHAWKGDLRDEFEAWLDALDEIPDGFDPDPDTTDSPDLATAFGDLASLALESRKTNRRTAEAFTRWNTVLTGFQDDLERLRERERARLESQPPPENVPPDLAAFLVDFHDRLTRVARAQATPPAAKRGLFGNDSQWKAAWKTQQTALDIALSHFQTLLKGQGFQRILTLGQPLDPTRMVVVEARLMPERDPHTVISEVAPGWLLGSRVLRPAQVIVSIPEPQST